MTVPPELSSKVRRRARNRCEYCRMSQTLQGASFHLEHIRPRSRGGATKLANLALACPACNLHKADRIVAKDLITETSVSLFHPRQDRWSEHFKWAGTEIRGKTASGRATIRALHLNSPRRLLIREAEYRFGLFPPS